MSSNDKIVRPKDKVVRAKEKVVRSHKKHEGLYISPALPGGKGIHMGYTLKRVLTRLELSTTDLGALLGITQQSAHAMCKKKYLHAATLVKISEALNHDVLRYLYRPEHLPGNAALKERIKLLEKENEQLKSENDYLKKINALLEKSK